MSHPFRLGDTVYHPINGKGAVYHADHRTVRVHYAADGLRRSHSDMGSLSFTEWPKAQHVRPIQIGYHLVNKATYMDAAYYDGNQWRWLNSSGGTSSTAVGVDLSSIKYLGDTWDAVMALEPA